MIPIPLQRSNVGVGLAACGRTADGRMHSPPSNIKNGISRRDCLKTGVTLLMGAAFAQGPLALAAGQETTHRQLRFTIALVNPKPRELQDQTLWLYVPAAEGPTQRLAALNVSMPHQRLSDALGQAIVKLDFLKFPPLGTKIVTLAADVLLKNEPEATLLPNPQDWLGAERFIETGDPRIQALAAELKQPTGRDTAQAIYAWIRQNLRYTAYAADVLGALDALLRGGGDCTEYACLSVALARANGIPARRVGGYVIARDSVLRPADYHDWAEVYFGGAWRLLDAQKGRWLEPAEQYVAFRYGRDQAPNPIGSAQRFRVQGELEVRLM